MSDVWIGLPGWAVVMLVLLAAVAALLVICTGFNVQMRRDKDGGWLVTLAGHGLRRRRNMRERRLPHMPKEPPVA